MNGTVTSVKLPKKLFQKMLEKIICDGYGMRGKSKWMVEAISEFMQLPDHTELASIAEEMEGELITTSIRFPEELVKLLDQTVIKVREQHPVIEGVRSNVIRAAIIQRLIRR
jgi:hypothetical protein